MKDVKLIIIISNKTNPTMKLIIFLIEKSGMSAFKQQIH